MGAMEGGRYRVLYRAFRPARWSELVGQEHIARSLRNAVARGRVAHAYLLSGPRGTGKTTIARILARALNCLNPVEGEPCGACEPCLRIAAGASTDVLELDAASNRGIDEIRALREQVRFAPAEERVKVYIVDEVHMLTLDAANALLKTLEEPPPRLCFILCTTDPERLPPTVLSRCQRFALRRLSLEEIAGRLEVVAATAGIDLDPAAARDLARRADGGMRDALALLEQVRAYAGDRVDRTAVLEALGGLGVEAAIALSRVLEAGDARALWAWLDERWREGADPRALATALRDLWHGWLLRAIGADAVLDGDGGTAVPTPRGFGRARLIADLERWIAVAREARLSDDPRLELEVALLESLEAPSAAAVNMGALAPAPALAGGVPVGGGAAAPASAPPSAAARGSRMERAAPAGAATPPATAGGGEAWARAIDALKRQRPQLAAYLMTGRAASVGADEVVVEVPYDFHRQALQEPEHRRVVEAALAEAYGGPRRLRVVVVRQGG